VVSCYLQEILARGAVALLGTTFITPFRASGHKVRVVKALVNLLRSLFSRRLIISFLFTYDKKLKYK
jgi:hypothetical protein